MKIKFPFLKKNLFSGKTNIPETKEDILTIADIIAPSFIDVQQNYIKIGERLARTYFVFSYLHQ